MGEDRGRPPSQFDDTSALVHRIFMDMDSILSSSHHTPTDMFKSLPCCCVQGCPAESDRQQTLQRETRQSVMHFDWLLALIAATCATR
mmetsp:Transcript_3846/g.8637  ORF Transcript_3846/g.8637 Transcript_3846/m.8637 type:complete len:88 (-) Transcript_3846:9-272(-)